MEYMIGHIGNALCLTHHDNKLYSGGTDGNVHIWAGTNTDTCDKLATLRGRRIGVICLTIHDNKLYSVDGDSTIRIWNIETYEQIGTLRGHIGGVRCLAIHDNKLYSGSVDRTIRIWNTETYELAVSYTNLTLPTSDLV